MFRQKQPRRVVWNRMLSTLYTIIRLKISVIAPVRFVVVTLTRYVTEFVNSVQIGVSNC